MPKAPKTNFDAPTALHEQESERLFRDHLLSRYIQVRHLDGDAIEINGQALSIVYRASADGPRAVRIVVAPMPPAPARKPLHLPA